MAKTANQRLHSSSVLNQIRLLRLSEEMTQKILVFLKTLDDDLAEKLLTRLANIKARGVSPKTFTNTRLVNLSRFVKDAVTSQGKEIESILTPDMIEVANREVGFQVKAIADAVPIAVDVVTPPKAMLAAIVTTNPLEGMVLSDWVASWAAGKTQRVIGEIRKGIASGDVAENIVSRLTGTRKAQFLDGVLEVSRRGARALVRTVVNGISTAARELLYSQNKDIVKGVQWVSTLDTLTSPICRSRDGKVYPVDSGPRPPAHISCRSTTISVLKSWQEMGVDLSAVPVGRRPYVVNGMTGDVPATMTYADWFAEQSEDVQKEVLGKARFEMYKQGATLDSFVDELTGKQKNL